MGQLLKERIFSCRSKFFPFRVDPFWTHFVSQGMKEEATKVVSLKDRGLLRSASKFFILVGWLVVLGVTAL